jgi:hypothetical protein
MRNNGAITVKWLIEPILYSANHFHSGFAWVRKEQNGPWDLIDKEGNVITHDFQANFVQFPGYIRETSQDLAEFTNSIKGKIYYGFVNLSGDAVISPVYQEVRFFSEGLAAVQQDNFWGVIDRTGAVVIPFIYEGLASFQQGLIAAQRDGKWGYIDRRGQTVIDFVLDTSSLNEYMKGLYPIRLNGKEGLMDKERNWVLEAVYEKVYSGTEDLIGVQKDGKVGFVDSEGRVAIDFQYEGLPWATPEKITSSYPLYAFSEGRAIVLLPGSNMKDPSLGVINKKGELLFKLPGWPRGRYSEGFLLVWRRSDSSLGLVDKTGKWISLPSPLEVIHYGLVSDGNLLVRVPVESRDKNAGKFGYLRIKAKK